MQRVIIFLILLITFSNCDKWDVHLQYSEGFCEHIKTDTCITCGNEYYKVICGDNPPIYENVVYSDCIAYLYSDINCEEDTYGAIQIKAYDSGYDICDDISISYSGGYCKFGAHITEDDMIAFLTLTILITLVILFTILIVMITITVRIIVIKDKDKIKEFIETIDKSEI